MTQNGDMNALPNGSRLVFTIVLPIFRTRESPELSYLRTAVIHLLSSCPSALPGIISHYRNSVPSVRRRTRIFCRIDIHHRNITVRCYVAIDQISGSGVGMVSVIADLGDLPDAGSLFFFPQPHPTRIKQQASIHIEFRLKNSLFIVSSRKQRLFPFSPRCVADIYHPVLATPALSRNSTYSTLTLFLLPSFCFPASFTEISPP